MKPERLESIPRGEMVAVLDREFARISAELGCVAEERIVAIAQSPEAYRKTTDAAEWSGGQFDGRIRVPVGPGQGSIADATIRRTLAHEITHACLTLTGRWPAWLQEGLAAAAIWRHRFAGASRQAGGMVARQGKLPKLANLGQDWSRLDTGSTPSQRTDYRSRPSRRSMPATARTGIRNLLHNPDRLPAMTADLERRLGLSPSAEYVKAK